MDMLKGEQIAEANLTDWRKLAQGLHARYMIDDFSTGARFVAAVARRATRSATTRVRPSVKGMSTSSWSATMPSTAMTKAPNTLLNG